MKTRKNIPQANHLMGSMRSMGYTFESALADIIDNSISAECREVRLQFPKDALHCFVSILDDGYGMSSEELFNAMRYGSSASEDERSAEDLGRFGLGLKAASLSQCKKLTVVSKQDDSISALSWDYDYILKHKDWLVIELSDEEIAKVPSAQSLFEQKSGTLVVWENFDIIEKSSNGQVYAALCDYKDKIIKHLALIFHRYIDAPKKEKVTMYLNNHKISALDPFLEGHPKTTRKKEIDIAINDSNDVERHVMVQPVVLPFYKDLSESDKNKLGGVESLKTKQGFYVYRNRRLIIWGTWFGLPRNELTKNARIRVDIPNTLDDIWNIDIKKQSASIPKSIQNQLRKKVEEVMDISVRQQTHRGRPNKVNDKIDYLWNRIEGRDNLYFYEINKDSNLFNFVRSKISDEAYTYVEMLIDEIEKNIPIQQIYTDQSSNAIIEKDDDNREEEVFLKAVQVIEFAISFGLDKTTKEIIDHTLLSEPFCNYAGVKDMLYKHYSI